MYESDHLDYCHIKQRSYIAKGERIHEAQVDLRLEGFDRTICTTRSSSDPDKALAAALTFAVKACRKARDVYQSMAEAS